MMAERELYGDHTDEVVEAETEADEVKKAADLREIRMKTRYGQPRKDDKGVPSACDCGEPLTVTTSYNPNRRGEKFMECPIDLSYGRGQGCGFRRRWIPACQDEFVQIRDDMNEIMTGIGKANKQIQDHEVGLFALEMQVEDLMDEKKYEALERKCEALEMKCEELETKYEALERKYQRLTTLDDLERKHEALERKYEALSSLSRFLNP